MNPTKTIIILGFGMMLIGAIMLLVNLSSLPIRDYTLINTGIGALIGGGIMIKLCALNKEAVQV